MASTLTLDRAALPDAVERAIEEDERVILARDGQPIAAIVPAADEWEQGGRKTTALADVIRRHGLDA